MPLLIHTVLVLVSDWLGHIGLEGCVQLTAGLRVWFDLVPSECVFKLEDRSKVL